MKAGGGTGVNIEPQIELYDKLKADRMGDINIQAGISDQDGELTLHGTGALASFDGNDKFATSEGIEYSVKVVTLSEIWDKYVIGRYNHIHFLKIDVEGWEKKVLEGMDFGKYRPWVLCIESTLPGTETPCWDQWEDIVLNNRYTFLGMNGINRYYGADEFLGRLNAFPDKSLDKYYEIIPYETAELGVAAKQKKDRISKIRQSKILAPVRAIYRKVKYGGK